MDGRLLTSAQAAGYIGMGVTYVCKLARDGRIPYLRIRPGRAAPLRFRIADLDEFIMRRRRPSTRYYDPSDAQLPKLLVLRLLGLAWTKNTYVAAKLLKDYSPESIRRAIEVAYHARMERQVRKEFNKKLISLMDTRSRYRRMSKQKCCPKCGTDLVTAVENG